MTKEKWLRERYLLIAKYPGCRYDLNEVVDDVNGLDKYPKNFKKLKWWEERGTPEQSIGLYLMIKFVKVLTSKYWRVGDIVPVEEYRVSTTNKEMKFLYFILKYNHNFSLDEVEPATEEDYEKFKEKEGIS